MNKGRVKYIAFYATEQLNDENRNSVLAATNKIDYVCSALNKNGYQVEIVSPSWTKHHRGFFSGKVIEINDNVELKTFSSFGAELKLLRILKYLWSLTQLLLYLLFNTQKYETVFVYHSPILSLPIRVVKRIKKLNIVLEVEEIYSSIDKSKFLKKQEYKAFKAADNFILSTELLNDKLNKDRKPFVTLYGTYKVEKDVRVKQNDGKTHLVYAGTFDPQKGGAFTAVSVAKYLDNKYHIHIIGFGSKEDTSSIKNKISEISEVTDCKLTYDGLLYGGDYIEFLQKCDIGLSTQIPDAIYNETSFPSKILSYMANGLMVVSIRIKVIEKSKITDAIQYYDNNDPKEIANSIKQLTSIAHEDNRELIRELDSEFVVDINLLLKGKD